MRKTIAFSSRRRAASESSRILREVVYLCIYILLITSVLLIGVCCRCYFRRGEVDV
jgi:hypothetical protein